MDRLGWSTAPEVLASSFANASLSVLDSSDPSAVLAVARAADFDRTLLVVRFNPFELIWGFAFRRNDGTQSSA